MFNHVMEKTNLERDLIEKIDLNKVPKHIAIIMDGNRRWSRRRMFSIKKGHIEGINALMNTVKASIDLGIEVITAYAFSTENWNRPAWEVKALMELFKFYLKSKRREMIDNGVVFDIIGDISKFSQDVIDEIHETKRLTKQNTNIKLILAFNYGGRNEITRAVKKMLKNYQTSPFSIDTITEDFIASHLDTAYLPDPDLLIRTGGEKRISNFLLWQISYSEIYTTNKYWPDFSKNDLLEAIVDFQGRQRRRGK